MSENLLISEYTPDRSGTRPRAFMDTFAALYPQLQDVDFRKTATEFEVPMFFVQERMRPAVERKPFADWYPMIQAPVKDMVVFDSSGHRPLWEQPDEFVDYMVGTVLAQTSS